MPEQTSSIISKVWGMCGPLRDDGVDSEALAAAQADVLHITPYRSFPSNVTASAAKRWEYVRWADAAPGRVIVEDDFTSELAASSKPEETVFSLAGRGNVIYMNTFSQTGRRVEVGDLESFLRHARCLTGRTEFSVLIHQFVQARRNGNAAIAGFCRDGGEFYESRAATADFLGTTPRTVTRAIDELLVAGVIREAGCRETPAGRRTRCYRLAEPRGDSHDDMSGDESSHDEMSSDVPSPLHGLNPDGSSGLPVTGCHPIRQVDNKWF